MVTVGEIGRSLRGAAALVSRRPDAIAAFDVSAGGFARSFAAFAFTIPAFVVNLALHRRILGLSVEGGAVFDHVPLMLAIGAAHVAGLACLPLAMAFVLRGGLFAQNYAAFAVATNWIAVFGSLALSLPAALYLMGLEPSALVTLLTMAFAAIVLEAQWFATKVTLGVSSAVATGVTALGLSLQFVIFGLLQAVLV